MIDPDLRSLLDTLGPEAPEADVDPRWDAMLDGALPDDEARRLVAKAAASRDGGDVITAFEPLDDDFLARSAERMLAVRERPARTYAPAAEVPAAPVRASEPAPLPTSWARQLWEALVRPTVLAPLALAMALVLVLPGVLQQGGELPVYEVTVLSGDRAVRGGERPADDVHVFTPGSLVELRLAPAEAVQARVTAEARVQGDDSAVDMDVEVQQDAAGVLLVRGTMPEAAAAQAGPRTIEVWLRTGADADARLVKVPVQVAPAP